MPRKLRVEYPGAIYQVMNRGDHREDIFRDDLDRTRFVETLGEVCVKTEWQVHAYCLMPNRFHLVVETPQPNLVAGMKWFLPRDVVASRAGPQHYGTELAEAAEAKAERMVTEELARRGWKPEEVAARRKGDVEKVEIAQRLRRETTMTLEWIAARLRMGTKTHLTRLLYWQNRELTNKA